MDKIDNKEIRKIIFNKYGGHCSYCGTELDIDNFQIDHIVPKRRGSTMTQLDKINIKRGGDKLNNYNPSCRSCNSSKSVLSIEDFRGQIIHKLTQIKRDSSTYRILLRFKLIEEKEPKIMFYFEYYNYYNKKKYGKKIHRHQQI